MKESGFRHNNWKGVCDVNTRVADNLVLFVSGRPKQLQAITLENTKSAVLKNKLKL